MCKAIKAFGENKIESASPGVVGVIEPDQRNGSGANAWIPSWVSPLPVVLRPRGTVGEGGRLIGGSASLSLRVRMSAVLSILDITRSFVN